MKKRNILIALAMLIVVMFSACSGETPQGPGNVRVILDSGRNTRSLESNVLLDTASYKITAIYQGTGNVEPVSTDAEASVKEATLSLFPGSWKIQVEAFNKANQKIGVGMSAPVSIESGQTASCTVRINECSGFGILNVMLSGVYEKHVVKATIESASGAMKPTEFNLDQINDTYYGSMNLENGSYLFNLYLNDNNIWTEAVRVVADGQTNASVSVSHDNKITLSTAPDVKPNRIMADSLEEGATLNEGKSYTFHSVEPSCWFVDGNQQSGMTRDFTLSVFGFTPGASCTVGALSGDGTYKTFSSMHFQVMDSSRRNVKASVRNAMNFIGDDVFIDFEGLPEEETRITVHFGPTYSSSCDLSASHSRMNVMIPPSIDTVGEYELTFTAEEGSGIVIPPIKINLVAHDLAPSYAVSVNSEAYKGDFVRVDIRNIPFGVLAKGYLDDSEMWYSETYHSGQSEISFHVDENLKAGPHKFEVKLFNAGRELPLTGNNTTVTIKDEYTLPSSLTLEFPETMYSGEWVRVAMSPALAVGMGGEVKCDNIVIDRPWIVAGRPYIEFRIPNDITPGSHVFSFTGNFNGTVYDLGQVNATVSEFAKTEIVGEVPRYVRDYYRNVDIVCNDPDFIAYRGDVRLYLNGRAITEDYKMQGENTCTAFFGENLVSGKEYVITGSVMMKGKEISFKPMKFIASDNYLQISRRSKYEAGSIHYSMTPKIILNGEAYDKFTLRAYDEGGFDELLPVEDGVEYNWTYSGKKPFLFMEAEVRDVNGILLLREDYRLHNFEVDIMGPETIYLSDAGIGDEQVYSISFNRDDVDWGPNSTGYVWKVDGVWQECTGSDFSITWGRSMKGSHNIECYRRVGRYSYYLAGKQVVVTNEKLNPAMDFDIVNIRRIYSDSVGYEFDLESEIPLDENHLKVSVLMDGKDIVNGYNMYFTRKDNAVVGAYFWIPNDCIGKTLSINVLRLDDNGDVIARNSAEYAMQDIHLRCYGNYHQKIYYGLTYHVEGIGVGENYSIYVDGKELDKVNDLKSIDGNSFAFSLEQFGYGKHEIMVKTATGISEVSSWYAEPGLKFTTEEQNLKPDESLTATLKLFNDPKDNLPADVTYSFWYQYPGEGKVVLEPNSTGIFEIPTDRKNQTRVNVGYKAECGTVVYENTLYMPLRNVELVGVPRQIVRGSVPKSYDVELKWYNNLVDLSLFDFEWELDNEKITSTGSTATLTIPTDSDSSILIKMIKKADPSDSYWISFNIKVVDEPVI